MGARSFLHNLPCHFPFASLCPHFLDTIEKDRSRLTLLATIIFHSSYAVNNDPRVQKRGNLRPDLGHISLALNIKFEFKEAEKLFVKIGAKIPYLLRNERALRVINDEPKGRLKIL